MTRRRINYSVWGIGASRLGLGASYALADDHENPIEAVVRSLERRTGLVCCAGPRSEGTALSHGEPTEQHYACTLGAPVARRYGGGYTPRGEVWIAIPIGQGPKRKAK